MIFTFMQKSPHLFEIDFSIAETASQVLQSSLSKSSNINLNPAIGLEQIRRDKANRSVGNNDRYENDIRMR